MTKEIYNLVRDGYNKVVTNHEYGGNNTKVDIELFNTYNKLLRNLNDNLAKTKVIELGCGNGYPVGHNLIESGFDYTGVDISEEQIKLARLGLEEMKKYFIIGKMTDFVKIIEPKSIDGVITMFADFHEPRGLRVQMYIDIHSLLKKGGYLFLTCPLNAWEGHIEDYYGIRMYWSTFSAEWYKITMRDIGFELIEEAYRETLNSKGQKEEQIFLLFKKL